MMMMMMIIIIIIIIIIKQLLGCETWSLREEHRLKVLHNTVQRSLFGPKTEEVKGEWRKLHKEELSDLY